MPNSNLPFFSIVVPCFNQEDFLAETLDSVLLQNYENWECIVVNDGSTDQSEKIIDEYIQKDVRFIKINQKNVGLAKTRNNGINAANGIWILPLDGDDKIGSKYLQLTKNEIDRNKDVKLIYCKAKLFGTVNEVWDLPKYCYQELLFENQIFCSAIYRRSDFLQTSGYDAQMKVGYEDWEFWIRFLSEDDIVIQLDFFQFFYRQRENSMISFISDKEKLNTTELYIFQKHQEKYAQVLNKFFPEEPILKSLKRIILNLKTLEKIKKTSTYKSVYKVERELTYFFKKLIK